MKQTLKQSMEIKTDDITTLVIENRDGRRWQRLEMTFGVYTAEEFVVCSVTWPREAIALARTKLDEFERELEGE